MLKKHKLVLSVIFLLSVVSCLKILQSISGADLNEIKQRKKLIAIMAYGASSYFLYRGQPMGFEYELLTNFSREMQLELEIRVTRNMDDIIYMVQHGKGDIIAANLAVTKRRLERVHFTDHLVTTKQVLVQRRGQDMIQNQVELIGRKIHLRKGSHYFERIQHLSEELGGDIYIETVPGDIITEDLIAMVASGQIKYTIANQDIALINQAYYPDIDVSMAVSFPQRIAWVIRDDTPDFEGAINSYIAKVKRNGMLQELYNRYFKVQRVYAERNEKSLHSLTGNQISGYDKLLKKSARILELDWRLLASLTFQESRFNPRARSWAGARGLMQVMPGTAAGFGISNLNNPEENIKAGTEYLKYLQELWKPEIKDSKERIKFILASYNAGPGHVEDARLLTKKHGKNPDIWFNNVEVFLKNLSNPRLYNDPDVKHGYCRGEEPYKYVRIILKRYKQYQNFVQ